MEYDVPDEIKILPTDQEISVGPDSFDSILLDDRVGTQGTLGTVLEGVEQVVKEIDSSRVHEDIQDTQVAIKPENNPAHPLEPSPQFQADETDGCIRAIGKV
jgi:hypothetical protein